MKTGNKLLVDEQLKEIMAEYDNILLRINRLKSLLKLNAKVTMEGFSVDEGLKANVDFSDQTTTYGDWTISRNDFKSSIRLRLKNIALGDRG